MSAAAAIARREFAAFFRLPLGWVVIALYLSLTGAVFAIGAMVPGEPATLRTFFGLTNWILMFVAPAISMRLLSEELRSGTIEPLMTAPVSDWQVVAGKFAGGWLFFMAMLAPTLIYPATLEFLADPDYGPIAAGYLGLAMLGMLYIAIGLLFSAATPNQTLAFLGALFFMLLIRLATLQGPRFLGEPFDRALQAMSIDLRMEDFSKGVIDTGNIVFFVAASVWFVALAVVVTESRRWR